MTTVTPAVRPSVHWWRRRGTGIAAAAVAVFVLTWGYRFTTLGGSFGGFENDHFVPFAYAKQVEAGEQPLRDFTGIGLQGAWPSLTFEISAEAQRLFGDNLRSEALVTVTGTAIGAAAACVAAAQLAPIGWALLTTLGTVLLLPTLYNYPKVLLLGVFAVAACAHARRRGVATVAVLAVLTAVAFLFRHDYAVYIGSGAVAVVVAAAWRTSRAPGHLVAYALLTLLLLTPSLIYIQRHTGLPHYLHDAVLVSRSEAARTQFRWPRFTAGGPRGGDARWTTWLRRGANAESWLYYLIVATPFLGVALWRRAGVAGREPWQTPAVLSIAFTLLVANGFLLRGNLESRLGEVGPLWAVIGAVALGCATSRLPRERAATFIVRIALVVILLAGTAVSVGAIGDVAGQLKTAGVLHTEQTISDQAISVWRQLGALPRAYWSSPNVKGSLVVVQYLNRCTDPGEHVLVESYQPEVLALADRRFAGGRLNYVADLLTDEEHQREIVSYLRQQKPRLALVEDRLRHVYDTDLPLVQQYIRSEYDLTGVIPPNREGRFAVYARRGVTPRSTFGPQALPCYR